ncbi:unnamed protein product, partial [Urochloa humidicola]
SPFLAFAPHPDGGWRGGGDAGSEVVSPRRLPCLAGAGPLSTPGADPGRLVSPPIVDLRPLSSRAICLGAPPPSPRRQFLASRRHRPRPHGLRRPRRQAGRRTPPPPPPPHPLPYLLLSSILHLVLPKKKKIDEPLAVARRLPPGVAAGRQGRRRRHAAWWRVRPRRLDVSLAQRRCPCTRMANVRARANARCFASELSLALISK